MPALPLAQLLLEPVSLVLPGWLCSPAALQQVAPHLAVLTTLYRAESLRHPAPETAEQGKMLFLSAGCPQPPCCSPPLLQGRLGHNPGDAGTVLGLHTPVPGAVAALTAHLPWC